VSTEKINHVVYAQLTSLFGTNKYFAKGSESVVKLNWLAKQNGDEEAIPDLMK
jgi:hypothetical protein